MIIELKTKTRLISNRRNRILLTLVSPVYSVRNKQSKLEISKVPFHRRCGIPASVNEGTPAYTTSSLWNGMINPLKRNAVTGFLWYQGEANGERNR